jgi:putative copper resistance protein D
LALLVDLFGYLSIILHGLAIVAQSMTLGGAVFLVFAARPLCWLLGTQGPVVTKTTARLTAWSALALVLIEAVVIGLQTAVLTETVELPVADVLRAAFALAGLAKVAAALTLALVLFRYGPRAPAWLLLPLGLVLLAAATLTTHAAARLDNRPALLAVEALHQLGAAIWIGGVPAFLAALNRLHNGAAWEAIGHRFSSISKLGVLCILISGVTMAWLYVVGPDGQGWDGFYGTAYGVMVSAKIAMFGALLLLGLGNLMLVRRLRLQPGTPVTRLKRFAEVEIGVGFSLFFAAASLTSVPPAVDLTQDRVAWHEIVDRNWPQVPRMQPPDRDKLYLPALQLQLDHEAAEHATHAAPAFVPGSGEIPARNAADIAWSENNHHWSGLLVLMIGVLALLNQAGLRWARHWPLLFLALAGFLFLRSDPEVWPQGQQGFFESLRDVEVLQHKFFVLLITAFGLFEWRVRAFGERRPDGTVRGAALVFPLITAVGGAALLTHSHAIANLKDQLLVEVTHTPLALAGIAAGWARWLELRLDPTGNRICGWIWPLCLVLVGLILLDYREA